MKGYFSQKMIDAGAGSGIWLKPDGTEVEVTTVSDIDCTCPYTDCQYVGEVVKWVRTARAETGRWLK